jgi:hypothetical protein
MMDFDFKMKNKIGSVIPEDFLSRSFNDIQAISILGKN